MAIEKVITIKGDTKSAVKSFDQLTATIQEQKDITIEFERELQKLEQQLKETGKASFNPKSKQIKDEIVNIKGAIKDQKLSLKGLNNERSRASKVTNINTESLSKNYGVVQLLDQVTGGLATQVRSVVDANRLLNVSLKGTRTALIATGIGAFVIALGLVVAYWDDIVELIGGANKELQKQIDLGKSNIITTNKQREALKLQRDILKNQEKDLGEINILLEKNLQKEIKLVEAGLLRRKELDAVLTARAMEITLAEKLRSIVSGGLGFVAGLTEDELAAMKIRKDGILDAETALLKLQKTQSEGTKEFRDAEDEYDKIKRERGVKAAELFKKEQDEKQEILDNAAAEEKTRAENIKKLDEKLRDEIKDQDAETRQEKLDLELERRQEDLDNLVTTEDEKTELQLSLDIIKFNKREELKKTQADEAAANKKTADEKAAAAQKIVDDEKIKDEQTVADGKQAILLSSINSAGSLVSLVAQLGEKNKALQAAAIIADSAVGVAKVIINTQAANAQAKAVFGTIAPPVAAGLILSNKISAGIGIASNLLATKKALSSLGGGGNVSGGNVGGGGGAPSAPSFNLVQGTGANQIAEGLAGQNQPIKAYVTSGDMSTSQSLDRNIIENSSL
jgi:hypothetical protein